MAGRPDPDHVVITKSRTNALPVALQKISIGAKQKRRKGGPPPQLGEPMTSLSTARTAFEELSRNSRSALPQKEFRQGLDAGRERLMRTGVYRSADLAVTDLQPVALRLQGENGASKTWARLEGELEVTVDEKRGQMVMGADADVGSDGRVSGHYEIRRYNLFGAADTLAVKVVAGAATAGSDIVALDGPSRPAPRPVAAEAGGLLPAVLPEAHASLDFPMAIGRDTGVTLSAGHRALAPRPGGPARQEVTEVEARVMHRPVGRPGGVEQTTSAGLFLAHHDASFTSPAALEKQAAGPSGRQAPHPVALEAPSSPAALAGLSAFAGGVRASARSRWGPGDVAVGSAPVRAGQVSVGGTVSVVGTHYVGGRAAAEVALPLSTHWPEGAMGPAQLTELPAVDPASLVEGEVAGAEKSFPPPAAVLGDWAAALGAPTTPLATPRLAKDTKGKLRAVVVPTGRPASWWDRLSGWLFPGAVLVGEASVQATAPLELPWSGAKPAGAATGGAAAAPAAAAAAAAAAEGGPSAAAPVTTTASRVPLTEAIVPGGSGGMLRGWALGGLAATERERSVGVGVYAQAGAKLVLPPPVPVPALSRMGLRSVVFGHAAVFGSGSAGMAQLALEGNTAELERRARASAGVGLWMPMGGLGLEVSYACLRALERPTDRVTPFQFRITGSW